MVKGFSYTFAYFKETKYFFLVIMKVTLKPIMHETNILLGVASWFLLALNGCCHFSVFLVVVKNLNGCHGYTWPSNLMFLCLDQVYGSLQSSIEETCSSPFI